MQFELRRAWLLPLLGILACALAAAATPTSAFAQSLPKTRVGVSAVADQTRVGVSAADIADSTTGKPFAYDGLAVGSPQHPFWDVTTHSWTLAANLKSGDQLLSDDGSLVTVAGLTSWTGSQWMWDLTVDQVHDFFVVAGSASVLVHNCGGSLDDLSQSGSELEPADAGGQLTRAGRAYAKHSDILPNVSGGPGAFNEAGQNALDEILTHPGTVQGTAQGGTFAGGSIFVHPSGIGAVFDSGGVFRYFGGFG